MGGSRALRDAVAGSERLWGGCRAPLVGYPSSRRAEAPTSVPPKPISQQGEGIVYQAERVLDELGLPRCATPSWHQVIYRQSMSCSFLSKGW